MLPRIALGSSLLPQGPAAGLSFSTKADYVDAIAQAGGLPLILPALENDDSVREALSSMQGLVLIGGADISPSRYGESPSPLTIALDQRRENFDFLALNLAMEIDLPVLAICLGCQVLNVSRGGTLYQDILAQRPDSAICHSRKSPPGYTLHEATIMPGSLWQKLRAAGL